MARKRTLNERRLTKRQVQELIKSGAQPRPDLAAPLESALRQPLVYELVGDRYLMVFGVLAGLAGKGDIYSGDDFRRFTRWCSKVDEDARHGRQSSVSHWAYYSLLKDRLISNIEGGSDEDPGARASRPGLAECSIVGSCRAEKCGRTKSCQ